MVRDTSGPILVYDRIDRNRRNTCLLLAFFAMVALPFIVYYALYIGSFLLSGSFPFIFFFGFPSLLLFKRSYWSLLSILLSYGVMGGTVLYAIYRYAAGMLLSLSPAAPAHPTQERALWRTVENLCIGAGLPQPKLYILESTAANAFAIGQNPEQACLVVTRGLLHLLDQREVEGVIAHQLSLIGNYDTRITTITAMMVWLLVLPLWWPFAILGWLGVLTTRQVLALVANIALVSVLCSLGAAVLVGYSLDSWLAFLEVTGFAYFCFGIPALGLFIQGRLSREKVFLADADALLLTRHPPGLARAIKKMATSGNAWMNLSFALAPLCIIDPLPRGDTETWVDRFLEVHPSVADRLDLLARMGGSISSAMLAEAEQEGARYAETRASSVNTT